MATSQQLIPELIQGSVGRDIVANDRLRLPQCAARRPAAIRCSLTRREPDHVDVALLAAVPRDNLAIQRFRVDHADPGHLECARFDCDSARLLEQRISISHAQDECIDPTQHGVYAIQTLDSVLRLHLLGDVFADACCSDDFADTRAQQRIVPANEAPHARTCEDLVLVMPCLGQIGKERGKHGLQVMRFGRDENLEPILAQ